MTHSSKERFKKKRSYPLKKKNIYDKLTKVKKAKDGEIK